MTDIRARFDWQSVAVTGPVEAVDPQGERWDVLLDCLEDNAWFSTDFERAPGVRGLQGWRLAPDEVRGLEVSPEDG